MMMMIIPLFLFCLIFEEAKSVILPNTTFEISSFTPEGLIYLLQSLDDKSDRISILITDVALSSSLIGQTLDQFLFKRPWWYVVKEPSDWNTFTQSAKHIVMKKFKYGVAEVLEKVSSIQYPSNCDQYFLHIDYHEGFDSFGHYFSGV